MAGKASKTESRTAVYVIAGKDEFLVSSRCEELLDSLLSREERPMCLYQPDMKQAKITDVLDELRTLPFLADKRVVLLRDAEDFISANRASFENYFESPSPTGVLILQVGTWLKTTRLAKRLPDIGTLISIGEIKSKDLPAFAVKYAQDKYHKKMSASTAYALIDLVGDSPGRLCSEIEKLAVFLGNESTITPRHLSEVIGGTRIFDAFAVIDSLMGGDAAGAILKLRNMFEGSREAEYTVVGAFAYHFRRLFQARVMLDHRQSERAILQQCRVWYNQKGFLNQLRQLSLSRIGTVLSQLARIDFKIKTGQTTAPVALEQLALTLAG